MTEVKQRYTAPTRDEFTPEQARLFATITGGPRSTGPQSVPFVDDEGRLLGPFGVAMLAPVVGEAVQNVGATLRYRGTLTTIQRELATLAVAQVKGSDFEWRAHAPLAAQVGVTEEQLAAMRAGEPPLGLDDGDALVWRTAQAIARDGALSEEAFRIARDGLGEALLAELVWLCGYYAMLAVAMRVFGPDLAVEDQA